MSHPVENQHAFPEPWKEGLYQAIFRRRDVRDFLPDPIPEETLVRILEAGNAAPSVGFMQPWCFLLLRDRGLRQRIKAHVEVERLKAAEAYTGERRKKYLGYKLEGILDAPLNLCVTCDTEHGKGPVLGRNTIRETDVYSTCLAVQNLWLAARVEGIGVGWVSILEPEFLRTTLGLPPTVIPVAYLCLGYPKAFAEKPMLESTGWLPKKSLAELVYEDRWQNPCATTPVNKPSNEMEHVQ